jgi:hypothetical protein
MFQPGDRVRWETVGDDGLPLVRYGFVGALNGDHTHATVMLDGDLTGDTLVEFTQLAPVSITTVEAGLEIRLMSCFNGGASADDTGGYELAELWAGSQQYVLRAAPDVISGTVNIRADLPHRYA